MVESAPGTLYVVSTPIGNMGDFSFRGVEVLRSVSLILAEDTRHVRKLLDHYGIAARVAAYHEHNEARSAAACLRRLAGGENIALVSDAGTPLLSDPGGRLVSAAANAGIAVTPIPGASALLAALVVSALAASSFTFHGFLPRKGTGRREMLSEIAECEHVSIIYEAANRLLATLSDLTEACGPDRACVVARELTKLYEEVRRGTLTDLSEYYDKSPARGEIVILIGGAVIESRDNSSLKQIASLLVAQGLSTRDVVSIMVRDHGVPRNLAYRMARDS